MHCVWCSSRQRTSRCRLTPTERQVRAVDEIYTCATGRQPGERVDCAGCGARHERDTLAWFQIGISFPGDPPREWLLAAICEACAELDIGAIEAGILEHQPRCRKTVGWREGQPTLYYVTDSDFARERAS